MIFLELHEGGIFNIQLQTQKSGCYQAKTRCVVYAFEDGLQDIAYMSGIGVFYLSCDWSHVTTEAMNIVKAHESSAEPNKCYDISNE